MRRNVLALLLFVSAAINGHTRIVYNVPDSIPACTANYVYDSQNYSIGQYVFSSGFTFKSFLGSFNWAAPFDIFAIANNRLENHRPTLFAFDDADYLVYGGPDTVAGWFPSTRTDIQLRPGYKTVAAYDDLLFLHEWSTLYTYRPGGTLIVLRSDLAPMLNQQVVDEDYNFIFISNAPEGGNRGDAVVVVDSTGWIRYRFAFNPPISLHNVTSLFMVNDSLYFTSGNLNQQFGRAMVYINLDCETYTATPVWISPAGFQSHVFSCSPGRLVAGCVPNVEIGPGTTSTGAVVKNAFSLYPNPARDDIYIVGDHMVSKGYALYGPDGKCVKRGVLDDSPARIDVVDLMPGVYSISVSGAGSEKFLKTH